jgi:urease accessory protein
MSARIALLQLASPALPIGGYSYSSGLEWAIESGQTKDEDSAREWIADALELLLARFDVPLMGAALALLDQPGRCSGGIDDATLAHLAALNAEAIASRETRELRQESAQMGYSLGRWLTAVVPDPATDARVTERLTPLSLPLAWALAAHRLGLDGPSAALAMLWSFVENQIMVLMKALPMGQIVAQRLLRSLAPNIESALQTALELPRTEWSSAAPLLAVASSHHETQYSRLFRS